MLESTYQKCLAYERKLAGLSCISQAATLIECSGILLDCRYRLDFLIDEHLVVELQAAGQLLPIHQAQVITYMKLPEPAVGLLVDLEVKLLKDGIRRRLA